MEDRDDTPADAIVPNGFPPVKDTVTGEETPGVERRTRRSAGINRAFRAIKAEHASQRTRLDLLSETLTRIASSGTFLVVHIAWFSGWIAWNTGLLGIPPFDPFPFGLLTMIVSLEAIFLSIFVLMSQGREAAIAELREELTLQVNLRMEEEVTKTLHLVAGLYTRLGHTLADDPELREMLEPLDATRIERQLAEQISESIPRMRKPRVPGLSNDGQSRSS